MLPAIPIRGTRDALREQNANPFLPQPVIRH
jgi:hypothetical protein